MDYRNAAQRIAYARRRKPSVATVPLFASAGTTSKAEPLPHHSLRPAQWVRFSFRTHLRFCLALASATVIASGALVLATNGLVGHGHAAQPVLADPAALAHHHAASKAARLVPVVNADRNRRVSRRIDIAEGVEDGDARLYTYQHVVLDLKGHATRPHAVDDSLQTEATSGDAAGESTPKQAVTALERGVPINVSLARPMTRQKAGVHEIVVAPQSRERIEALLQAAGIAAEDSQRLEEALARTELLPGDNLELLVDRVGAAPDGTPAHVSLARFNHGRSSNAVYGRADDGVFRATGDERLFARLSRDAMLSTYRQPVPASGAGGSVPARLMQAGAPSEIVQEVEKLAAQNNIVLEGKDGSPDLVDILFRKSAETDPELVFAEFTTGGRSQRLYRHEGNGSADYFNEDGAPMTKYLMHKPLPNGRLNDGFGWRVHPVLHVRKHHNGVDYDAPIGSPIVAAGDGVVEVISSEKGYGRYVRIRHQGGYSTTYAHLSSARRGLKVGQHVRQGEVIAYVGSTGYSTGPHLYYELKVGDQYVDPLTARLNAGEKLTGSSLLSFREEIDHVGQIVDEMTPPVIKDAGALQERSEGKGPRGDHGGHRR